MAWLCVGLHFSRNGSSWNAFCTSQLLLVRNRFVPAVFRSRSWISFRNLCMTVYKRFASFVLFMLVDDSPGAHRIPTDRFLPLFRDLLYSGESASFGEAILRQSLHFHECLHIHSITWSSQCGMFSSLPLMVDSFPAASLSHPIHPEAKQRNSHHSQRHPKIVWSPQMGRFLFFLSFTFRL